MNTTLPQLTLVSVIAVTMVFSATTALAEEIKRPRPNIILLMSDDQGYGDVGYRGHPHLKTPNLDAMAEAGMRFDRFYAASPSSVPSRFAALLGLHPARWGRSGMYANTLPKQPTTIAEALKAAGYRTGHFGKWQVGAVDPKNEEPNWGDRQYPQDFSPPAKHGFDVCFSTRCSVPTYNPGLVPEGWERPGEEAGDPFPGSYWDESDNRVTDNLEGDDSRVILDRVTPFIMQAANTDTPFFAAVWFHAPHSPVVAGPEYRKHYAELPERAQHYLGSITAMDAQIGRLNTLLDAVGVRENTLVLFCSSNGPRGKRDKIDNGSTGPLRGRKNEIFEGGIRVPALAVWPNVIASGSVSTEAISILDFFPTVVDALGLPWPASQPMDGESFWPVLREEPWIRSQPLYFIYQDHMAIVTPTHKASADGYGKKWRLFDLNKDPRELHNLVHENEMRLEKMKTLFEAWHASVAVPPAPEDLEKFGMR